MTGQGPSNGVNVEAHGPHLLDPSHAAGTRMPPGVPELRGGHQADTAHEADRTAAMTAARRSRSAHEIAEAVTETVTVRRCEPGPSPTETAIHLHCQGQRRTTGSCRGLATKPTAIQAFCFQCDLDYNHYKEKHPQCQLHQKMNGPKQLRLSVQLADQSVTPTASRESRTRRQLTTGSAVYYRRSAWIGSRTSRSALVTRRDTVLRLPGRGRS